MHNIIPIKNSNISKTYNENKEKENYNWINKKVNLNFFENKNLIKELRAKYLPDNEKQINSEPILNNMNNIYKKDSNEKIANNYIQQSFSSISYEGNSHGKINESDLMNNKSEEAEKEIINNIKEKRIKNVGDRNNGQKTIKLPKQKNIIIENRFYTEIVNSNIVLDKNLILNSLDETSSLKNNHNEKHKQNNNIIIDKNKINLQLNKDSSDNTNKNDINHFLSLSLKNMKLESINQNIGESSTNKELNRINNKEILENIFNSKKFEGTNSSKDQYYKENNDTLKSENENMKKELKNYEKLIAPLINYINDINRILYQKEINPSDIEKIIKNDNISKSSIYIKNLTRNLNESKNDIAYRLDQSNNTKKISLRKRKGKKIINLKLYKLKGKRLNRSEEDIKNAFYINNKIIFDRNQKGNYFYEDTSDKYIFDYYKNRNISCSACLIGNNNSQRGYSPGICCHLEDDDEDSNEFDKGQ